MGRNNLFTGPITEAGGTISMGPSRLKIGGKILESSLTQVILSGLVTGTLYHVYAVNIAGVLSLVVSTNFNSVGPAGYTSWKYVKAFYADLNVVSSFGSFVEIEGAPTSGPIDSPRPISNCTFSSEEWRYYRKGSLLRIVGGGVYATITGAMSIVHFFPNVTFNPLTPAQDVRAGLVRDVSSGTPHVALQTITYQVSTPTAMLLVSPSNGLFDATDPITLVAGDRMRLDFEVNISEWSTTPLKDL